MEIKWKLHISVASYFRRTNNFDGFRKFKVLGGSFIFAD